MINNDNFISQNDKIELNHELTAECFTKCAKWALNSTLALIKNSEVMVRFS